MYLVTETDLMREAMHATFPKYLKGTVTVLKSRSSRCDFGDIASVPVTEYVSITWGKKGLNLSCKC